MPGHADIGVTLQPAGSQQAPSAPGHGSGVPLVPSPGYVEHVSDAVSRQGKPGPPQQAPVTTGIRIATGLPYLGHEDVPARATLWTHARPLMARSARPVLARARTGQPEYRVRAHVFLDIGALDRAASCCRRRYVSRQELVTTSQSLRRLVRALFLQDQPIASSTVVARPRSQACAKASSPSPARIETTV